MYSNSTPSFQFCFILNLVIIKKGLVLRCFYLVSLLSFSRIYNFCIPSSLSIFYLNSLESLSSRVSSFLSFVHSFLLFSSCYDLLGCKLLILEVFLSSLVVSFSSYLTFFKVS